MNLKTLALASVAAFSVSLALAEGEGSGSGAGAGTGGNGTERSRGDAGSAPSGKVNAVGNSSTVTTSNPASNSSVTPWGPVNSEIAGNVSAPQR